LLKVFCRSFVRSVSSNAFNGCVANFCAAAVLYGQDAKRGIKLMTVAIRELDVAELDFIAGGGKLGDAAKVAGAAAVGTGVKLLVEAGAESLIGEFAIGGTAIAGPVGTLVGAAVGAGVAWWLLH